MKKEVLKYKPCEYTIMAMHLGISPIFFDCKIAKINVKKVVLCDESEENFKYILSMFSMKNKEFYTCRELISMLSYHVKTSKIPYLKRRIKNSYFIRN